MDKKTNEDLIKEIKDGNKEQLNNLIIQNEKYIKNLIKNCGISQSDNDFEDILSICQSRLVELVGSYDLNKGKFLTYIRKPLIQQINFEKYAKGDAIYLKIFKIYKENREDGKEINPAELYELCLSNGLQVSEAKIRAFISETLTKNINYNDAKLASLEETDQVNDLYEKFKEALDKYGACLTDKERKALSMKLIEHKKTKEIALFFKMDPSNCNALIKTAAAKIKLNLNK